MALASADVQAVENADTPAKARRLRSTLLAEKARGVTAKRQAEIDAALGLLRDAYGDELNTPEPASKPTAAAPKPGNSPGKTGKTTPGKTPGNRKTPSRPHGGRARPKSRAARFAGDVGRETAGYTQGAGQLVITVLGATIAFAVLYAVLRNAQRVAGGESAIELISTGIQRGVQIVVAPVDPLDPGAGSTARAVARAATAPGSATTTTKGTS